MNRANSAQCISLGQFFICTRHEIIYAFAYFRKSTLDKNINNYH